MARMSNAERDFKIRFPFARHTVQNEHGMGLPVWTVYAGDYLCAESWERRRAYALALEYVDIGLIQPDPNEQTGEQ